MEFSRQSILLDMDGGFVIDKNDIFKTINSGYKPAINLTEIIYFNPKHRLS